MLAINDSVVDYIIDLENLLEKAEQAETQPYTNIEVDAVYDFGSYLYRVWLGRRCLGTFYRSSINGQWTAEPFYRHRQAWEGGKAKFSTHQQAQDYIVKSYLG